MVSFSFITVVSILAILSNMEEKSSNPGASTA
jgi:hypothetical protein